MQNLLKVKSIITLSLTLAVIVLAVLSVTGTIGIASLASNPLVICVISAFTASYTSLYVRNKDKADDSILDTVNNSEQAMGWTKADLDKAMSLNVATTGYMQNVSQPVTPAKVVFTDVYPESNHEVLASD
jgi:hypothetical protein